MKKRLLGFLGLISTMVQALNCFDLKGRAVAGLFGIEMMTLCLYVTVKHSDIPNGVLMAYGLVVGGLTTGKVAEIIKGGTRGKANE